MEIKNRVVVVTGGARGIGKAFCQAFAAAGAEVVVVADIDGSAAEDVAAAIGGLGRRCDVSREAEIAALVSEVERRYGRVDIFCSNAGIAFGDGGDWSVAAAPNERWQRSWEINVMAHVYAARAVIPGMVARGAGYLVNTVSAAGLLCQVGDAAYTTTKHAALGFAESAAITHGDDGIRVSVVCPQYVATAMIGMPDGNVPPTRADVISADEVAARVLAGIEQERFLILTHPEVETYRQRKAADYDRWLAGMRKLRRQLLGEGGSLSLDAITRLPR